MNPRLWCELLVLHPFPNARLYPTWKVPAKDSPHTRSKPGSTQAAGNQTEPGRARKLRKELGFPQTSDHPDSGLPTGP